MNESESHLHFVASTSNTTVTRGIVFEITSVAKASITSGSGGAFGIGTKIGNSDRFRFRLSFSYTQVGFY